MVGLGVMGIGVWVGEGVLVGGSRVVVGGMAVCVDVAKGVGDAIAVGVGVGSPAPQPAMSQPLIRIATSGI
jgi:hypothetical protein